MRGIPRKQELILLTKSLEEVLKELDGIIRKYQGSARRKRKIWNQLRLATEDLDGIRSKLTFHVTAINAFTSSLSQGSLAQIETVLLQLVSEVRQGRPHPSLESLHETGNDSSVWRELESELAIEGISGAEVAKHKVSIKVFVQGLLSVSNVDTASLVEIASLTESGKDEPKSESLSQTPFAMHLSPEDPARLLITNDAKDGSLASVDEEEDDSVDEEYESADEEFTTIYAGASNSTIQPGLVEQLSLDEVPAHCDQVLLTEQSLIWEDALTYLDQVKIVLVRQPDKYIQFLDVMANFKRKVLDTPGAIEWVSAIFICYPELIQNFNFFLPPGYRIECGMVDNHQAFRVIMPFAAYVRIPDLEAMQSLIIGEEDLHVGLLKWIDPASLNILQPCSRIAAGWTTEESGSQVSGAIQARMTFLRRFKAFLARSKATEETAADTGRSPEAGNIIYVSGRT